MTAAEQLIQEGRRDLLARQISLRFGVSDPSTLRTLERATPDQLSECAERILTATSLDELLAPLR